MDESRDRDKTRELDYLYERLKHLDDAIRSIEALAQMRPEIVDRPPKDMSTSGKTGEEPT
jgi:hypothetical protein